MKQLWAKKKPLLFGSNQRVIQLANGLEFGLQRLEVLQPLLHLRLHLRADAVLPGGAVGVADRKHPGWVASAARALGTARLVPNHAVDQGTTEDLVGGREIGDQLVPLAESLLMFHSFY